MFQAFPDASAQYNSGGVKQDYQDAK